MDMKTWLNQVSLFSFHFAVRLTTLFTRLCEEESTRLLIKPKRSFQLLGLSKHSRKSLAFILRFGQLQFSRNLRQQ